MQVHYRIKEDGEFKSIFGNVHWGVNIDETPSRIFFNSYVQDEPIQIVAEYNLKEILTISRHNVSFEVYDYLDKNPLFYPILDIGHTIQRLKKAHLELSWIMHNENLYCLKNNTDFNLHKNKEDGLFRAFIEGWSYHSGEFKEFMEYCKLKDGYSLDELKQIFQERLVPILDKQILS